MPRWLTGTWSGRTAAWAASNALRNTCAMHHPTSTTAMVGATATIRIPMVPPASPTSIQGRRIPIRAVVRSLRRPNSRVAHHRQQRSDPGHECEVPRRVLDSDEAVDLQRQRHQQRCEEQERAACVGQCVERDEWPPDRHVDGRARRAAQLRGGLLRRCHHAACRCPGPSAGLNRHEHAAGTNGLPMTDGSERGAQGRRVPLNLSRRGGGVRSGFVPGCGAGAASVVSAAGPNACRGGLSRAGRAEGWRRRSRCPP